MLIIGSTPASRSGEGKGYRVTPQQKFKQNGGQCTENRVRREDKIENPKM